MATSLGKPVVRELSEDCVKEILKIHAARAMVIKVTNHGIFFRPKSRSEKCEQFVSWETIFKKGNGGMGWDQLRRDAIQKESVVEA